MKVAVIHPLKHHVYYSLEGVAKSGADVIGLFGYYNRGDFFDKLLNKTKFKSLVDGWKYEPIDKYVTTSFWIKFLFLLSKKWPSKFEKIYTKEFQKWCIMQLDNVDCIHVLQDYCNDVIRYAYEQGIQIVYEQIQPFDTVQRRILDEEVQKVGISPKYISARFPKEKIKKQIENIGYSTAIVTASDATYKSVIELGVKSNIIYRFPYGSDFAKVIRKKSIKYNNTLRVLYIGNISLIKGVQYVIEAAEQLQNSGIYFTFIGKPASTRDRFFINQIEKLKNCKYKESVPHTEIFNNYFENDVFIFQGLCEGFGMVTLEAMFCGLPCVVSTGGIGIVQDGFNGYVNENGDVETLVKNIMKLKDPILRKRMSQNAVMSANECTWEKYTNNISNVYLNMFGTNI